ncbi:bacteriohemerythrin [Psychromonas sp. KJ10-10]|uniref:bacteriohemerythrin n=1 Tax=Psychromonas sp. KJ10-10 TaxID=3391823 RepID=UPI0039B3DE59
MKSVDIFPWDEHFNTGLASIDKQHRKLVEIINRLASHVAYDASEESLATIFDELISYTEYHFKTEEKLWHEYLPNDDLDSAHQAVHQEFVTTVLKLKNAQQGAPLNEIAEQALGFLSKWLASHILDTDRHMSHIIFALQEGLDLDSAKQRAKIRMSGSTRLLIDIILSIYSTLSTNTLHLMKELKEHQVSEKEIDKHKLYSDLLLELSTDFVSLPLDEIDNYIQNGLQKMANYVGADRSYIFAYDFSKEVATNTYEWCNEGIEPQIETLKNVPIKVSKHWIETHQNGDYILIQDVYDLENIELRNILLQQDIKSLVTFPIFGLDKCKGFIGFDSVKTHHTFLDREIKLLELFLNFFLILKKEEITS